MPGDDPLDLLQFLAADPLFGEQMLQHCRGAAAKNLADQPAQERPRHFLARHPRLVNVDIALGDMGDEPFFSITCMTERMVV